MPLAGGSRRQGPRRGSCRDRVGQAYAPQRLRWLWPKKQGVGGVEAATVGKGSSHTSLSFEGKSSEALREFGRGLQKAEGEEMVAEGSSLPPLSHLPHPCLLSHLWPLWPMVVTKAGVDGGLFTPEDTQTQQPPRPYLLQARAPRSCDASSSPGGWEERVLQAESTAQTKAGQQGLVRLMEV